MDILSALFLSISMQLDLPPGLLRSVCYVESGYDIHAIHRNDGLGDSVGLCQVQLNTARQMGYKGSQATLRSNVKVNMLWAGRYLKKNIARYHGDLYKAVSAYNMGSHKLNAKGITANKSYVDKVFDAWVEGK